MDLDFKLKFIHVILSEKFKNYLTALLSAWAGPPLHFYACVGDF